MRSQPGAFERLTVKPERARKHIVELSDAINTFMASTPYVVDFMDNSQAGERSYYVHFVKEIPTELSAILGDVIQNLRSALDHLASHLVSIGSTGPKARRVYFPIFRSLAEYETGKMDKIRGMDAAAIAAIDSVQPYRMGSGWALWDLHKLNNLDKHNLLIPVWGNLVSHSFPKSKKIEMEALLESQYPSGLPRGMLMAASGPHFLEDGGKLLTLPTSEVGDGIEFRN